MSHFDRTWKKVDLKNLKTTQNKEPMHRGQMSAGVHGYAWYTNIIQNHGKRRVRLRRYDQMDETIDIARALDIMAEDISSDNADDEEVFICDFPEDSKVLKTVIKTIASTKKLWEERTELGNKFFDVSREMLKYGSVFFRKNPDGSLKKLTAEKMEGYVLDATDDTKVTHYLYNENAPYLNDNDDWVSNTSNNPSMDEMDIIPVSELLIFKLGESPFGKSVLDNVFRTWRQMSLIEDAIVIYRVVRAPERRAFYIDTGRLPAHKATSYIEEVKLKLRQKQTVRKEGELETEYNPASMQEDFFIATNAEGKGSRVETLQGGNNLDQIKDLVYLNKKLAMGLRIPAGYMESVYDDQAQGTQHNDGRLGTAYISELRYAGYIMRIQRNIADVLYEHLKFFARRLGVEFPEELEFKIAAPQSFAIYKENDLFSVLLNTYNSAENVKSISKKIALEKYLHWDKETLIENETQKLMEMGFTEDQIKQLKDFEIANIVYGNGALAKKYLPEEAMEAMESARF